MTDRPPTPRAQPGEVILELEHLAKTFRTGLLARPVVAVRDVSLTLQRGESLGFLGPNGSGKTTSIKCILSLIQPTQGRVALFGCAPTDPAARARVGYLPESAYFYDYLKPTEVLDYVGRLYGLDAATRRKRIPALLDRLGLGHAIDRTLRGFSKGMLQRVGIAQALIADPELLIFDEPMSGLDPLGRKEVRDLMADLRAEGKSLFFSSHVLGDVESLCDAVCILDRGVTVAQGRLHELLRADRRESEAVLELPDGSPQREDAAAALQALPGVTVRERAGATLRLWVATDAVPELTRQAIEVRAHLVELTPRRDSLEELFLRKAVNLQDEPNSGSAAAAVPAQRMGGSR